MQLHWLTLALLGLVCRHVQAEDDEILKPVKTGPSAVGVVWIQGAQIPAAAYVPVAQVLQQTSPYSMFVGIPAFTGDVAEPLELAKGIKRVIAALQTAGLGADAPIVIFGHSLGGAMAQDYTSTCTTCAAQVLMGATLLRKYDSSYPVPTLMLDGMLDGLMRVSRQAESFYRWQTQASDETQTLAFPVVVYEGVSHMQFASGTPPANVQAHDFKPAVSYDAAWALTAHTINNFLITQLDNLPPANVSRAKDYLKIELESTGVLVQPMIDSLVLEGFAHFSPPCNSDYPCPTCPPYPRYPAAQQGDTPQTDCTCGVPWVVQHAQRTLGGLKDTVIWLSADAIHAVSDISPVHLPHIFNAAKCVDETDCSINSTTVTEQRYPPLDGADTGAYFTSANELRTKLVSREAMWLQAGRTDVNFNDTDVNASLCALVNQKAWDWALANAGANATARFKAIGQPLVMGDDVFVGNAGPLWIDNPLQFNVAPDNSSVVVNAPCTHTPVDYPIAAAAGFHYCKLLSPARAMEWIYIDGLRYRGQL